VCPMVGFVRREPMSGSDGITGPPSIWTTGYPSLSRASLVTWTYRFAERRSVVRFDWRSHFTGRRSIAALNQFRQTPGRSRQDTARCRTTVLSARRIRLIPGTFREKHSSGYF
jgi:hypothetical protein